MKVKLIKNEDGTYDIEVRRTLRDEGPTQNASGVKPENLEAVVSPMIKAVHGPTTAGAGT